MKEETLRWLERAERDLEDAEALLARGSFASAGFFAQQTAEKALKGVLIERHASFPRIHDLKTLAREAKAPDDLAGRLRPLSAAYLAYRYPDVEADVSEAEATEMLRLSREVVAWARRQLS